MSTLPAPDPHFRPLLRQRWSDLLFLHWSVPVDWIAPRLPSGLTVETFEGAAWIGIVPFQMSRIRFAGLPAVPGLRAFPELNLRTYVKTAEGESGVWFFSLDADHSFAVRIARRFFHLPYQECSMVVNQEADGTIDYRACRRLTHDDPTMVPLRWNYRLRTEVARPAEPGSLDAFLCERYQFFSYSEDEDRFYRGRVRHAPYQLCAAELGHVDSGLFGWDGFPVPITPPDHVTGALPVEIEAARIVPA